jgi:hypothetical protein
VLGWSDETGAGVGRGGGGGGGPSVVSRVDAVGVGGAPGLGIPIIATRSQVARPVCSIWR